MSEKLLPGTLLTTSRVPQVKSSTSRGRLDPSLQHASHITKPQLRFNQKPNNHRSYRWCPSLKHKYNAQVPLGHILLDVKDESYLEMYVNRVPFPSILC